MRREKLDPTLAFSLRQRDAQIPPGLRTAQVWTSYRRCEPSASRCFIQRAEPKKEPKKEGSLLGDKLKKFGFNKMFDSTKSSSAGMCPVFFAPSLPRSRPLPRPVGG